MAQVHAQWGEAVGVLIFQKRSSPEAHQTSQTSEKPYRCSNDFVRRMHLNQEGVLGCLLYTSDAADEERLV